MNWLDFTLTVLDSLSYFASLVRGTGMNSDLLPLAVIMLFAGGIVFWVLLTLAALNGIFRGIRIAVLWIWDHFQGKSGGSMPHVK